MSDQSDFIVQIQQKEKEAAKMLKDVENKNNQRVLGASESSGQIVIEAEVKAKTVGQERFKETKEKAKEEYKRMLVDADNKRRDVIEGGKVNLDKAQKHIHKNFVGMFK